MFKGKDVEIKDLTVSVRGREIKLGGVKSIDLHTETGGLMTYHIEGFLNCSQEDAEFLMRELIGSNREKPASATFDDKKFTLDGTV